MFPPRKKPSEKMAELFRLTSSEEAWDDSIVIAIVRFTKSNIVIGFHDNSCTGSSCIICGNRTLCGCRTIIADGFVCRQIKACSDNGYDDGITDLVVDRNTEDNIDIISGSFADYGLYPATVCGVSGMLPTSACENDINGYGLITDYFTAEHMPSATCKMHRAVTLCRESKLVASEYCQSTAVVGIIYIPEGHPLRNASDMDVVQSYFYGASTNEYSAGIGKCRQCGW